MLFLLRHGETEFNQLGRFQGHMDSALTAAGIDQAHNMGAKLKTYLGQSAFSLHSSPLGRAKATARIIQSHIGGTDIRIDHRIAEIDIGDWSGMSLEDIEFTHPGALDGSTRYDWGFRAPRGETKVELLHRLLNWLAETEKSDVPIVAVSHGWAGLGLRSLYTGQSIETVGTKGTPHETIYQFIEGEIREL